MESNETQGGVRTKAAAGGGSLASRLVATVISALVFGALVYVSRFTPQFFGMQLFYPATAVGPPVGAWFGFWGGLGAVLGTVVSQLPAGLNPLVWIPANLAQGLYAWVPALLYRKDRVSTVGQWALFAVICLLANVLASFLLIWNLDLQGTVPFSVGLRTAFPSTIVGGSIWMIVVSPLIMNVVSPYVARAGLRFRSFF